MDVPFERDTKVVAGEDGYKLPIAEIVFILFVGLGFFGSIMLLAHYMSSIVKFFNWLIKLGYQRNPILWEISGITMVLSFGVMLYFFKKHNQKTYRLFEILISAASCIYTIQKMLYETDKPLTPLGILVTFMTAVYFTQRGFNNYFDGRDKERAKKVKSTQEPSTAQV